MTAAGVLRLVDPLVGLWLLAVGAIAWRSRPVSRVGPLTVLAGLCWFAGTAAAPLLFLHRGPLVQLHLSYPTGQLRRRSAVVVTAAVYVAALAEGLVRVPALTALLAVAVAAVAVRTFGATSGPARKAGGPALLAALAFAGMLGTSSLNQLLGWGADTGVALAYDVVICAAVALLLADLLAGRWVDATVTDLLLDLGTRAGVTGLRRQLRRALGDPTLEVGYWLPGREVYVDEQARSLRLDELGPGRVETRISDDAGRPLAVLVHDPVALDDPALLGSVAAAARLAVANARLQEEVEARTVELTAARRRIVEAGDRERQRLVAALAAGAERRLASVDELLVADAGADLPAADPLLEQVRRELHAATGELHELARGIRPPTLDRGGLAAAVPELAARSRLDVAVRVTAGRLPAVVEAAVYFVCAEGLANVGKHAGACSVGIEVVEQEGAVVVSVVDDGGGGADPRGSGLRGLADRVQALGGVLVVESSGGGDGTRGTRLVARLPLDRPAAGEPRP